MLYNYNTVQYGTDYRHCDKLHSAQHLWQKHEMNILKVAICHDASVRQYCILVVLYSIQAELERDSHGIGYNVAGARVGLAWLQMFPMMFYRDSEVQAFKASLDPGRPGQGLVRWPWLWSRTAWGRVCESRLYGLCISSIIIMIGWQFDQNFELCGKKKEAVSSFCPFAPGASRELLSRED